MFHPDGPTFAELARQALSSTKEGYDLLAPKFDRTPFRTPEAVIRATVDAVEGPIDQALDLCCGTGAALAVLQQRCRRAVTGVDFSPGMLAVAATRLDATPGARRAPVPITLVEADVLELELEERFDLVTCFGAFGHFLPQEEPRLIAAIHRHLRPGGRFAFATATRPPWWHLGRWLATGFNVAMRVRNAVVDPPFVMYYLTFLLPGCLERLQEAGFSTTVHHPVQQGPWAAMRVVVATKRRG